METRTVRGRSAGEISGSEGASGRCAVAGAPGRPGARARGREVVMSKSIDGGRDRARARRRVRAPRAPLCPSASSSRLYNKGLRECTRRGSRREEVRSSISTVALSEPLAGVGLGDLGLLPLATAQVSPDLGARVAFPAGGPRRGRGRSSSSSSRRRQPPRARRVRARARRETCAGAPPTCGPSSRAPPPPRR